MSDNYNYINDLAVLKPLLHNADRVDVRTVQSKATLSDFVAAMLSFYPWWLRALYAVRPILVRALGLVRHSITREYFQVKPEDVSFTPGDMVGLFIVHAAQKGRFWLAETPGDKHLTAFIGVVVETQASGINRFHVIVIVHYRHWTGPVYFNLIRPFECLVMRQMTRAGARGVSA